MPTYIILEKLRDQGLKSIKDLPQTVQEAAKGLEAMGGKLLGYYAVMGEYDFVGIVELPSDEAMMAGLLGAAISHGFVSTTTLRAFTMEEFAALLKMLS